MYFGILILRLILRMISNTLLEICFKTTTSTLFYKILLKRALKHCFEVYLNHILAKQSSNGSNLYLHLYRPQQLLVLFHRLYWNILLKYKEYSQLSLNGHLYKTDTSVKRTPRVSPCFSLIPLFNSLQDGLLSKTDT